MQPLIRNISPVWHRAFSLIVDHGEGSYLYTTEGQRYLDFTCGIGVTNTGHCHPHVVEAIQRQAAKLLHGQLNIMYHEPVLRLTDSLRKLLPPKMDSFFFSNSGAEAVEGAIKLARAATGRTNVIVFQGSFHGRTIGAMSLTTSKTVYRAGYQPLMSGVFTAPFPYAYRYGWDEDRTIEWCLNELKLLLKSQTAPEETAAILIEPILGEGGYVPAPCKFLRALRQLCDEHSILLIFDEIQSGFGRTAAWFAFEHVGVVPDVLVLAKGIASGLPLSAVVSTRELMEKWPVGSHGGTYGGNVLACAAAVATIEAMHDDGMVANAEALGKHLMAGLRELQQRHSLIGDVRGEGLMVGVEFTQADGTPDAAAVKALIQACYERHLLLLSCGTYGNVIRWIPPLIVTEAQIDEALGIFEQALTALAVPA